LRGRVACEWDGCHACEPQLATSKVEVSNDNLMKSYFKIAIP